MGRVVSLGRHAYSALNCEKHRGSGSTRTTALNHPSGFRIDLLGILYKINRFSIVRTLLIRVYFASDAGVLCVRERT